MRAVDSLCFDCIVLIVAIVLDDVLSSQACTHRRFVLETKTVYKLWPPGSVARATRVNR